MCGIVGYLGQRNVVPILLSGLKRLEYRGYDSAGIAVLENETIAIRKTKGHVDELVAKVQAEPLAGYAGLGHTRWATHGEPSDINSHPHTDVKGEIAIIHNGIIENYLKLKLWLTEQGCVFVSETDTEVIAHLLNHYYEGDMLATIQKVIPLLQGSYALGIMAKSEPDKIFCVRKDSPLVVGEASHGCFMASDIPAILDYTKEVYLLDDMDIAVLSKDKIAFYSQFGLPIEKEKMVITWTIQSAQKGGYEHFMLKEIHEEPTAIRDTLQPMMDMETLSIRQENTKLTAEDVQKIENITICACGTAYHAGLMGKTLIEHFARIPVEVDIASEYRYRNPIVRPNTLFIVVSQSGETADTIAALREAHRNNCKVLAITNVIGSTVYREADMVMPTWAGPEIAVASTKAYISQLGVFYILALDFAQKLGKIDAATVSNYIEQLHRLPELTQSLLNKKADIQRFANQYFDQQHVFFLGRGIDYSLAMEASLKLKEISYIHSEAYAAGELKHGTIALIEQGTLVVALATQPLLLDKMISNVKEVKVRGARVLAVATEDCAEIAAEVDEVWLLPSVPAELTPMLAVIPMQLFAYYMALENGCSIDTPRNLAKSVTVE